MNLLLDTHIWIWAAGDSRRLSRSVAHALANAENQLWLSSVSVWEAVMLARRGRIRLAEEPAAWIARMLSVVPVAEAPLTFDVALETLRLTLPHRDPSDAFLVASARVFGLTLVTADTRLIEAQAVPVLANR